jgi:hypothetical protein
MIPSDSKFAAYLTAVSILLAMAAGFGAGKLTAPKRVPCSVVVVDAVGNKHMWQEVCEL